MPEQAMAQHSIGLNGLRHAGVFANDLNPSRMMRDDYFMQANLGGFHANFRNNYIYLPAKRLKDITPDFRLNMLTNQVLEDVYSPNEKFAHMGVDIQGPSFMKSSGTFAWAFQVRNRTAITADHVDFHVAKFVYEGTDYSPQHNIPFTANPYDLAGLQWTELALSGAGVLYMNGKHELFGGITMKLLLSGGGFYLQNLRSDYEVLNDSLLVVDNFLAGVGYSLPLDYGNNALDFSDGYFRGAGGAFTAGITYFRYSRNADGPGIGDPCNNLPAEYLLMLGLSVGDIGFTGLSRKAETHIYDERPAYWMNVDDFRYQNINQFTHEISWQFYGDSLASLNGEDFRLWLPGFAGIQLDLRLKKNLYLFAMLNQGLNLGKQRLHYPSTLALMPHWENGDFSVGIPLSLYQWQIPNLGLSLRYRWLTLGSDNLIGWAGFGNITGIDFYLSLGYGLEKGSCLKKKGDRRYRQMKSKRIPCAKF